MRSRHLCMNLSGTRGKQRGTRNFELELLRKPGRLQIPLCQRIFVGRRGMSGRLRHSGFVRPSLKRLRACARPFDIPWTNACVFGNPRVLIGSGKRDASGGFRVFLRGRHRVKNFGFHFGIMPGKLFVERRFFPSFVPSANENRRLRIPSFRGGMELRPLHYPKLERNRLDAFDGGSVFGQFLDLVLRLPLRVRIRMERIGLRSYFLRGN